MKRVISKSKQLKTVKATPTLVIGYMYIFFPRHFFKGVHFCDFCFCVSRKQNLQKTKLKAFARLGHNSFLYTLIPYRREAAFFVIK